MSREELANTPVYTVMGGKDLLMTVPRMAAFVERLKEEGGKVVMDVEEGWGHVQTCTDSYTPQRLDWIFQLWLFLLLYSSFQTGCFVLY